MFEERVDHWADLQDRSVGYNPTFLKRARAKREAAEQERRRQEAMRRRDAERSAIEFARFSRATAKAEMRFRKLMAEIAARTNSAPKQSVKEIIELAELKYGLPAGSIAGASRNRLIVKARYEAIAEAAVARPDLSSVALGRLFGGRDHTSILHCLKKMGVQRREEQAAA